MREIPRAALLCGLLSLACAVDTARAGTEDDSCLEAFKLENFQPASPTFGQQVPSSAYSARTTVVMLLSAG